MRIVAVAGLGLLSLLLREARQQRLGLLWVAQLCSQKPDDPILKCLGLVAHAACAPSQRSGIAAVKGGGKGILFGRGHRGPGIHPILNVARQKADEAVAKLNRA